MSLIRGTLEPVDLSTYFFLELGTMADYMHTMQAIGFELCVMRCIFDGSIIIWGIAYNGREANMGNTIASVNGYDDGIRSMAIFTKEGHLYLSFLHAHVSRGDADFEEAWANPANRFRSSF